MLEKIDKRNFKKVWIWYAVAAVIAAVAAAAVLYTVIGTGTAVTHHHDWVELLPLSGRDHNCICRGGGRSVRHHLLGYRSGMHDKADAERRSKHYAVRDTDIVFQRRSGHRLFYLQKLYDQMPVVREDSKKRVAVLPVVRCGA